MGTATPPTPEKKKPRTFLEVYRGFNSLWAPGPLHPSHGWSQGIFSPVLSHSTGLQLCPSEQGVVVGGDTRTSSGLTCTAGCLPSLLLGELSPVACCSRNWRATWRACKRDTAGWARGRGCSSPSSSLEQHPDTGLAGQTLHWCHTSMTRTTHYR